jgi:hypothetical protein
MARDNVNFAEQLKASQEKWLTSLSSSKKAKNKSPAW